MQAPRPRAPAEVRAGDSQNQPPQIEALRLVPTAPLLEAQDAQGAASIQTFQVQVDFRSEALPAAPAAPAADTPPEAGPETEPAPSADEAQAAD